MRTIIRTLSAFIRAIFIYKQALTLENLALRQQLVINLRKEKRASRLKPQDRIFWVFLSHIWDGWKSSLILVKPDTVIGWHRQGFRLYWRWQSRKKKAGRTSASDPKFVPGLRRSSLSRSAVKLLEYAPHVLRRFTTNLDTESSTVSQIEFRTRGTRIPQKHIEYIKRIFRENQGWGEDKIYEELRVSDFYRFEICENALLAQQPDAGYEYRNCQID